MDGLDTPQPNIIPHCLSRAFLQCWLNVSPHPSTNVPSWHQPHQRLRMGFCLQRDISNGLARALQISPPLSLFQLLDLADESSLSPSTHRCHPWGITWHNSYNKEHVIAGLVQDSGHGSDTVMVRMALQVLRGKKKLNRLCGYNYVLEQLLIGNFLLHAPV